MKSTCDLWQDIKSVNLGPSKPERTNSKSHEIRQAKKRSKVGPSVRQ